METQGDEIILSGIEADIVIMEECQSQLRSKGVVREVCVDRQSAGKIHRG